MKQLLWLLLLPLLAATLCADKLLLTGGTEVTGTVLAYSNLTFHVLGTDGKPAKYSNGQVRSIAFGDRTQPATLAMRTGSLSGTLTKFEGTSFHLTLDSGETKSLASVLVKSVVLGRSGVAGERGEESAETVDELKIPDALAHGEEIALAELVARGQVTLVFYYGNVNQPGVQCRLMNNFLDNVVKKDFRVAIRKVDIGGWESPVAKQYKVTAIPRLDIYDSAGRLNTSVVGNRLAEITSILKKVR